MGELNEAGHLLERIARAVRRSLGWADRGMNRVFTWRYNPLYQSGALVVISLLIMLGTGLYLLIFYRIGGPYASVERISSQVWTGRWIRALHRYAADAAVVAAVVHGLRMFAQGRSWGPRALAWFSGLFLVAILYVCAWTGYVMVWDAHGFVLAVEGARLLDLLPVFSEPLARTFVGERPIPGAFFFLNLFAHIAIPVGMAGALWLHISRVSRPVLIPPRVLWVGLLGTLFAVAVFWPAPLTGPADPLMIPTEVALDVFYGFWLPALRSGGPWAAWTGLLVGSLLLFAVPFISRPRPEQQPPASHVDQRLCTACEQCYLDCPYEAIAMVARTDGRQGLVAAVDPALCVSCGICAGSCAPMGVGPPLRTGRDQLSEVTDFVSTHRPTADQIVVVGCNRAVVGTGTEKLATNPHVNANGPDLVFRVSCVGNLHTSTVEYLVRAGAGGVLVAACPPRDCWSREGPNWLDERLYHEREAELQERVDRRRVDVVYAASGERATLQRSVDALRGAIARLADQAAEQEPEIDMECDPPPADDAEVVSPLGGSS